ncbi:MAG: glutaminase, partial [Opitutaceae bacterium]|nr:glutaminase [Cytophagales bacterium]
MNYQQVLNQIQKDIQPLLGTGKLADYIPALAGADPNKFGMSVHT